MTMGRKVNSAYQRVKLITYFGTCLPRNCVPSFCNLLELDHRLEVHMGEYRNFLRRGRVGQAPEQRVCKRRS